MSHRLRMTAEIAEWLGDLRESDPVTAIEVGAAVVTLMESAEAKAVPLVTPAGEPVIEDQRERLDHSYQRMLEILQVLRRQCAEASGRRHQLQLRLTEARSAAQAGHADQATVPDAERRLAAAQRREKVLTGQTYRLQVAVDGFRTSKETAKAMVTATDARRRIQDAFLAAGIEDDEGPTEAEVQEMAAKTDEALAQADELLRSAMAAAGLDAPASQRLHASAGLLELHADPLGADVRILFGVEPPGTAVLLAVLEGEDAISQHRDRAVSLASELLAEIGRDGWSSGSPDAAAAGPEFSDTGTFLETCFADLAGVIAERAAELASVASLRSLRAERSMAEMASMTGTDEADLRMVERGGLQEATVRDAASYVRALGGRLELSAVIDGERHLLAPTPLSEIP